MLSLFATREGRGIGRGAGGVGGEGESYTSGAGDRTGTTSESFGDAGAIGETSPGTFAPASLEVIGLAASGREIIALASKRLFESMDDDEHDNDEEGVHDNNEEEVREGKTAEALLSSVSDTAAASYAPSTTSAIIDNNAEPVCGLGVLTPVLECDVVATMHALDSKKVALAASRGRKGGKVSTSCTGDPSAMKTATYSAICQPVDTGIGGACGSVSGSSGNIGRTCHDLHSVDATPHVESPGRRQHQTKRDRQELLVGVNGESCVRFDLPSAVKANAVTEKCQEGGRLQVEGDRWVGAGRAGEGAESRRRDWTGDSENGRGEVTGVSLSLPRAAYIPASTSKGTGKQALASSAIDSVICSDSAAGELPADATSKSGKHFATTKSLLVQTVIAKVGDSSRFSPGHPPAGRGGLPIGVRARCPIVKLRGIERERHGIQGWNAEQDIAETFPALEMANSTVGAELRCQSFKEIDPAVTESMAASVQYSVPNGLAGSGSINSGSADAARGTPPLDSSDEIAGDEGALPATVTGLRNSTNAEMTSDISIVSETSGKTKYMAGEAMSAATISSLVSPSQSSGGQPRGIEAARTIGQVFKPSMPCLSSKIQPFSTANFESSSDNSASRSADFGNLAFATGDSAHGPPTLSAATIVDSAVAHSEHTGARAVGEGAQGQVGSRHRCNALCDSTGNTDNNSELSSYKSGFLKEPLGSGSIAGGKHVNAKFPSATSAPSARALPESDELLGYHQTLGGQKACGEGSRDRSIPLSGLGSVKYSRNTERPSKDEGSMDNSCVGVRCDPGVSAPPPRDDRQLEVGEDKGEIFKTHLESRSDCKGTTAQDSVFRRCSEDNLEEESSEDERYNYSVRV